MLRSISSFLICVALLLATEVSVRYFLADNVSGRFQYGYSPTAGVVYESDGTVKLVRAGGRTYRPQSFKLKRDPGTIRIFTVGDSVPRGPSLKGAYPYILGQILNEKGIKTESFNLGTAGYGVRRCHVVLKQALTLHPSLIILHVNDSNEYEDEREWNRSQEFKSWAPKNWLMKSFIIRRLYEIKTEQIFWPLLPDVVRNQKDLNDFDAKLAALYNADKEKQWDALVRQETEKSVETVVAAHIPLILISRVTARILPQDGTPHLEKSWLNDFCESLVRPGVYHIPMYEVFKDQPVLPLFADSAHMHEPGHKILAEAIAARIEPLAREIIALQEKTP